MRKEIALVICCVFLMFGGVALGQQEVSNGTREYIGEVASLEMTPEDLSEMEGEFYYNPTTTNQYTPNVQKQALFSIVEMAQNGELKIK